MFPRPSRPARLSAALIGVLLLPTLAAGGGEASALGPPGPPAAPLGHLTPGRPHAQAPQTNPHHTPPGTNTSPEVSRLYRKAASAARNHERARHAVDKQRATTKRLTRAVQDKRREYDKLRRAVGSAAAMQYRSGVGPGARLVLAENPETFLSNAASLRQGNRVAMRMVHTAHDMRVALTDKRAAADQALKKLRQRQREQLRIKKGIEAELVRAERRVARQAAARQRAAQQFAAAGQGPTVRPQPAAVRVSHQSGCPSGASPAAPASASTKWVAPVGGGYTLTAGFAAQGGRWASGHTGQDFAVPTGTPVRSVGAGVVTKTSCGDSYGVQVVVRHDNGYFTQYAHLSMLQIKAGDRVKAGQQIGLSGSTGNSSGPHLHFEVRVTEQSGSAVNPAPWLRERGVSI